MNLFFQQLAASKVTRIPVVPPSGSVMLEENDFSTLKSDWNNQSYSIVNNMLEMIETNNNWSNQVQWNVKSAMQYSTIQIDLVLSDVNSIFRFGKRDSYTGMFCEVDFENGNLNLYNIATSAILKSLVIPFPITTGNYSIKLTKQNYNYPVLFSIENGSNFVQLEIGYNEFSPFIMGMMNGKPFMSLNKGHVLIDNFKYQSDTREGVKLIAFGDSIVDNAEIWRENGFDSFQHTWDSKLRTYLNTDMNMSGMPGNSMIDLDTRVQYDILPQKPQYCYFYDKPNVENYDHWLTYMQSIISKLEGAGIIPILSTFQPASTPEGQAEYTKMNNWVKASGYNYVNIAYAVSLNNDEVTRDESVYIDGVHFNEKGNDLFYYQIINDIGTLLK